MNEFQPSRQKADLAEVVEMLLDKGVVINADVAVSVGDTQLLGVQIRAAIASFETAAKYGLEFPEGTDMRRVAEQVDDPELAEMDRSNIAVDPTRGVNVTGEESEDDEAAEKGDEADDENDAEGERGSERLAARPRPDEPNSGGYNLLSDDESEGEEGDAAGDEEPSNGSENDSERSDGETAEAEVEEDDDDD